MRKTKFKSAVLHEHTTSHDGRHSSENTTEIKAEVHSCANSFHPSPFSKYLQKGDKKQKYVKTTTTEMENLCRFGAGNTY